MKDLFTMPLADIGWDDLTGFLRLSAPKCERPAEGPRLEYKSEYATSGITKSIVVMANTQGGLILVGISAADEAGKTVPVELTPDPKFRTSLKNGYRCRTKSIAQAS